MFLVVRVALSLWSSASKSALWSIPSNALKFSTGTKTNYVLESNGKTSTTEKNNTASLFEEATTTKKTKENTVDTDLERVDVGPLSCCCQVSSLHFNAALVFGLPIHRPKKFQLLRPPPPTAAFCSH
jgi:hypothetical protein